MPKETQDRQTETQQVEQTPRPVEATPSNKRIAKNALMLYIRMFLTMIVGLYTSRVVLATLGVEDYGIYGVVGGVVGMMGFINASMSGATSRFLTFELGRGDKKRLADTFSSALIVHIGIALVVLVLAETVGLWFLNNKLVIPEGRMTAARWVYHCFILSAMLGITQVPYNATIIAHEKMDVYAYVEILHVSLKLLIVYLLVIGNFDKLIFYAILTLAVSILIRMVYRIYCIRHFNETHFHWLWRKDILKPLLSFSGWNIYGNICVTIRQQGTNFLINIFFGVIFNAASAVATTIQGVIKGFTYSSTMAFRPQIIKQYANGDIKQMRKLIKNALITAIALMGIISVPTFVEIDYFMEFWLVTPPPMATTFVKILIFTAFFALITIIFTITIEATGKNKYLNVFTGTIYMLTIPVMYLLFKLGFNVEYSYYSILGANILIFTSNVLISKYLIHELRLSIICEILAKTAVVYVLAALPAMYVKTVFTPSFIRMICNSILCIISTSLFSYIILLDKSTRKIALDMVKRKIFPRH